MNTPLLYPLRFHSQFKQTIWGGSRIAALKNTVTPLEKIGESWEISDVSGSESVVMDGALQGLTLSALLKDYKEQLVGESVYHRYGDTFPLLIKFIDAQDGLSIQVHPDDTVAKARHNCLGKSEMWYVMEAQNNAQLVSGFNRVLTTEAYQRFVEEGRVEEIVKYHSAQEGDVFYLPPGRVHAIGKGILLAEIQETSNITYRIYDYNRTDSNGQHRELHVKDAQDVINYHDNKVEKIPYSSQPNTPTPLLATPFFTTNLLELTRPLERDYTELDSFVIYIALSGEFQVSVDTLISASTDASVSSAVAMDGVTESLTRVTENLTLVAGQTLLLPACFARSVVTPISKTVKLLEVYL